MIALFVNAIVGVAPSPLLFVNVIPVPATKLLTYAPAVSVPNSTELAAIVATPFDAIVISPLTFENTYDEPEITFSALNLVFTLESR